jgi:hypothetical protein
MKYATILGRDAVQSVKSVGYIQAKARGGTVPSTECAAVCPERFVYRIQSAALSYATAPQRRLRIHRRFGEMCYLHLKGSKERWNLSTEQYGGTAVTASDTTTDI